MVNVQWTHVKVTHMMIIFYLVKETVVPVYFMFIILTRSLHTYWSVFKVLHKIELPIDHP